MRKFLTLCFLGILISNTVSGQTEEALLAGNFEPQKTVKDTSNKPEEKKLNYPPSELKGSVINKADREYDAMGFMVSTDIYTQLFKKKSKDINSLARTANSHRLNSNTEEAEYWYSRFIHQTKNPQHFLHYAEVLKSNNNCEAAKIWFAKYKTALGQKALDISLNDCEEINAFQSYGTIKIDKAIGLNSEASDFCAIPLGKGVVFTSSRETKRHFKTLDSWTKESFTDLFYAEQGSQGDFKQAEPISGNLNTKTHEGTATFNRAGTVMVFTRNNNKKTGRKSVKNLQLFIAYKGEDGYWSDAELLPLNGADFSSCHPTLSKDNMKIYFASNRSGGQGGFDLYVSNFEKGEWSTPKNLGPEVNGPRNELFPFIGADGTLYFSSDGHSGLGGLDLFMSKSRDSSWNAPVHLGMPINSSKDDFGFYIDEKKRKGFLSSNRNQGEGKDDIYAINVNGKWPFENDFHMARVLVYEEDTDRPLPDANVSIVEKMSAAKTPVTSYWITEMDGAFDFKIKRGTSYLFEIAKKGYAPLKKYVTAEELLKNSSFGLNLVQQKYRPYKILLNDLREEETDDVFQVRIKNKKTGEDFLISFNGLDEALTDLECGNEYEVTLLKNGKVYKTIHLKLPENCDAQRPGEISFEIDKENLVADPDNYFEVNDHLPSEQAPKDWTPEMFKDYFLGNKNGKFKPGQVIILRDVFYDFDRYVIRADASKDLDRVAELMKQFPNIKIALEAHTDFRGTESYNRNLSDKRAENARDYILSQGIDVGRLSTHGFGEGRPRINCSNCSDTDHQLNRRTEIRIVAY